MHPLRARFLGGSSFGALMAADGVVGGGSVETGAASPAPTQSESTGAAAAAPVDGAAGANGGAPAAAAPAADQSAAPAAPDGAAHAKTESATSLLAEAKAKSPGEAEAAKPDAAAEGAKPDAEKPAPAEAKKPDAPAKPQEKKAEGEAAPVKEAPAEKPPAQTYEAFRLPEGITLDAEKTKTFTSILDNAEFKPQDRAQALIDLHLNEVLRVQKEANEHQQTVWNQFQQANKDELRKDPEMGGNRMETSLGRAKWVIEQYGGDAEQQKALLAELSYTGMGNSVRMTRLLNNVADLLSEGEVVPAAPIAVKTQQSRREKFYPSMQGGNGKTA